MERFLDGLPWQIEAEIKRERNPDHYPGNGNSFVTPLKFYPEYVLTT